MIVQDIEDAVSRAVTQLLLKEPFYAHILGNISREYSARTDTIAVYHGPMGYSLAINPEWFLAHLNCLEQRVAAIKHETLHVIFLHLFRGTNFENKVAYDLACDLVVNQNLGDWDDLPEAVTLEVFEQFGVVLERDCELTYYYEELLKILDDRESLNNELKEFLASTQNVLGDHKIWADEAPCETDRLKHDAMLVRATDRCSDISDLPGRVQELIQGMLERMSPQVDWRRTLRVFAASAGRTRITHTIKRRSKRYGTRPGTRIKQFSKIAVALDTSGSVDDHTLGMFFSEIHGIWRNGVEVVVIECDCEVQKVYPYHGACPEGVTGRGGTAFDPVFEYMNQQRHQQFDGCIYLTDGWAATPEIRPPCKMLWVICSDGTEDYTNFGPAIKLKD